MKRSRSLVLLMLLALACRKETPAPTVQDRTESTPLTSSGTPSKTTSPKTVNSGTASRDLPSRPSTGARSAERGDEGTLSVNSKSRASSTRSAPAGRSSRAARLLASDAPTMYHAANLDRPGYVYVLLQLPRGTTKVLVYRTRALNVSRPVWVDAGTDGTAVVEIIADMLGKPQDQYFEIRFSASDRRPYAGPAWVSDLATVRARR